MFGQAIYVVPEKKLVAVFTSNITGQDMYISGSLLREYILPAVVSPEPLASAPDEKAQLDDLLAEMTEATGQGIVWLTEHEGFAKDGIFKRVASPSFQFEYRLGCVKTLIRHSDQIMRMKTPMNGIITASIYRIPRSWKTVFLPMRLKDFDPKEYSSPPISTK